MRNIATAMTLAAALLLAACTNDEPALQPSEPVLVDDCPDGQPRKDGEPCR